MKTTTPVTASSIKQHNLRAVTSYVYNHVHVTKLEIAQKADLSLPTVTKNVQTLLDEGYLVKGMSQNSTGGRKAQTYDFRSAAKCAIGIDVNEAYTTMCAVDLHGKIIAQRRFSGKFNGSKSQSANRIKAIEKFAADLEAAGSDVLGIAFSIHGFVTPDNSHISFGTLVDQTDLPKGSMNSSFSMPNTLVHDAYASAEADLWEDHTIDNAICLYLGERLGGAVVIDGETRYGTNMRNGAIEHMIIVPDGRECYCGKRGCANPYCSTNFLLEDDTSGKNVEQLGHFFKRLRNGDEQANKRFDEWLDYLALTISNASYLLSGDIIIGGEAAQYLTDEDLAKIKERVDAQDTLNTGTFIIRKGMCAPDQDTIGAALYYIKPFVNSLCGR